MPWLKRGCCVNDDDDDVDDTQIICCNGRFVQGSKVTSYVE